MMESLYLAVIQHHTCCMEVVPSHYCLSSLPNMFFYFFQQWYTCSTKAVCVWLADRIDLQLHMYQLKTLIKIVKVRKLKKKLGSFSSQFEKSERLNPTKLN